MIKRISEKTLLGIAGLGPPYMRREAIGSIMRESAKPDLSSCLLRDAINFFKPFLS